MKAAEIAIQRLQNSLLHPTTCNKIAFSGENVGKEGVRAILNAHGIQDPNLGRSDEELKKSRVGIRTYASFVIQGSHDTMLKLAFGEQHVDFSSKADNSHLTRDVKIEQWATDMYNFMALKYGEDNIASFVVHWGLE